MTKTRTKKKVGCVVQAQRHHGFANIDMHIVQRVRWSSGEVLSMADRRFGRGWLFVMLILASVFASSCTCAPSRQSSKSCNILACKPHVRVPVASPIAAKRIVPGVIPVAFSVMDSGEAALSIPIAVSPGRDAPDVRISYNSANGDGVLRVGFSLSAGSAITRCPKTMAIDGMTHEVTFTNDDAYCLDGQRMVEVAHNGDTIEFRTLPDSQIKILGHVFENGPAGANAFANGAAMRSGWSVSSADVVPLRKRRARI